MLVNIVTMLVVEVTTTANTKGHPMPRTIEQALICGDTITTNGVTFRIVKSSRFSVDVEVTSPGEIELNPDEHPDEEVGWTACDPNAYGL